MMYIGRDALRVPFSKAIGDPRSSERGLLSKLPERSKALKQSKIRLRWAT